MTVLLLIFTVRHSPEFTANAYVTDVLLTAVTLCQYSDALLALNP